MHRRRFNTALLWSLPVALAHPSLQAAQENEAASGVKAALERGALAAIQSLGQPGGFFDNQSLRIPLPEPLRSAQGPARMLGMGKQFDQLELSINRAAEQAIPEARQLVMDAVRKLSVRDAVGLVTGGDSAVTDYFRRTTGDALNERFLPVVTRSIGNTGLSAQYDKVAGKLAAAGLMEGSKANLNQYVTGKTVDGLFTMIAAEERKIRQDPAGTGIAILRKVFGQ